MTNHWNDIQHSDCMMVIGANPAENHPISMKYVQKAQKNGAKLISVDPRFTRTSQLADVYSPLRSGTDIAFIGGLIHYALQHNLFHEEYVKHYTNATYLVNEDFTFDDGLFSGYDEDTRSYDKSTWTFQRDEDGEILKDETMQDPRSVFQLLKNHYQRYDIETVSAMTGATAEDFTNVAKAFCGTGTADKVGTIMYAMGTTQHTVGSQNVRSYAIIQLLLGNIGRPGGGVNAMRGECNVQGSTDFALLFHLMPGYIGAPTVSERHKSLSAYNEHETPDTGFWSNKPNFLASLLKAHFGENATKENDFLYDYFPKGRKNYSHISLFESMFEGDIKGLITWGQNPMVGGPNATMEREAMTKLDWLVCMDLWETETASFWKEKAGNDPSVIDTEVFLLPACGPFEKEGSVSNSGRWMQYRWKALEPKNESKSDAWFAHNLYKKLKEMYVNESNEVAKPFNALDWQFGDGDYPEIDLISREINGYDLKTGKTITNFTHLKDDGTTSSGNWIYSGFYPDASPSEDKNLSKRRDDKDTGMENYLNWSFAWPVNRRNLYNRCSADPSGKPWRSDKAGIWWDGEAWTGYDVPDFGAATDPSGTGGKNPFIMLPDGVAGLFAAGPTDGPFPEHYEPFESPIPNAFSSIELNPAVHIWKGPHNKRGKFADFPIVATTYRLTEHWQSGSMSRNLEWPSELMPHMFIELSEELAKEKGINAKDKVLVKSARGEIEALAMITKRFKPYNIRGKKIHHIGMPWHYGYEGIAKGSIANHLTSHIGDANTMIPEYKAFLCDVRRVDV